MPSPFDEMNNDQLDDEIERLASGRDIAALAEAVTERERRKEHQLTLF